MEKIVFLHHQRCGGNSFRHYFIHNIFAFPYNEQKRKSIVKDIKEKNHPLYEVEPGIYIQELEGHCKFFTILREPIDRALSWIELYARSDGYEASKVFKPMSEFDSPNEFWEKIYKKCKGIPTFSINFNMFDTYVKSFTNDQTIPKVTDEHFELACERLKNIDVLFYNKETFTEDIETLSKVWDVKLHPTNFGKVFKEGNSDVIETVPDWFKEFIAEKTSYDIKLWEFAQNN